MYHTRARGFSSAALLSWAILDHLGLVLGLSWARFGPGLGLFWVYLGHLGVCIGAETLSWLVCGLFLYFFAILIPISGPKINQEISKLGVQFWFHFLVASGSVSGRILDPCTSLGRQGSPLRLVFDVSWVVLG